MCIVCATTTLDPRFLILIRVYSLSLSLPLYATRICMVSLFRCKQAASLSRARATRIMSFIGGESRDCRIGAGHLWTAGSRYRRLPSWSISGLLWELCQLALSPNSKHLSVPARLSQCARGRCGKQRNAKKKLDASSPRIRERNLGAAAAAPHRTPIFRPPRHPARSSSAALWRKKKKIIRFPILACRSAAPRGRISESQS